MFSWICPKCGQEVPPAYSECPNCNPVKAAVAETPVVQTAAPPPPPVERVARPSDPIPVPFGRVETAPPPEPAHKSPWLVMVLAAIGIVALLAVLYLYVLPSKRSTTASTNEPSATGQTGSPGATGATGTSAKPVHPYAKYLEVTGLRVNEDSKQRAQVQFIVVNHSAADLPDLDMHITVSSGDKSLFDFPFKLTSLGPYETRPGSTVLKTEMKPYEMPDWQFLKANFEITSAPQ